jgi:hypothetical protein
MHSHNLVKTLYKTPMFCDNIDRILAFIFYSPTLIDAG